MSFMENISDMLPVRVVPDSLPGAGDVDFTSGVEVGSYTHLAVTLIGLRNVESDGAGVSFLMRQGRSWICEVERRIEVIPAEELLPALDGFDLLHRLVYGKALSRSFMCDILHRVFKEKAKGNKRIHDTHLYGAIRDRMRCGDMRFLGKMPLWQSRKLGAWYSEFSSADSDLPCSSAESLDKAGFLLDEDLYPYAGNKESSFKRGLLTRCHSLVVDGEEGDAAMMAARLRFLRLRRRLFTAGEAEAAEIKLLSGLSVSPGIPVLDRLAYLAESEIRATPATC